jgi:FAD-linked oxidoreductase
MPTWTNWARNERCHPARLEEPRSEDEAAALLRDAADRGQRVRAVGSGHSFTPVCLTDGVAMSLRHLDRVLDVDHQTRRVRAQAGISVNALAHALHANGLALENQGDIDTQAIAGALATATHGTGTAFGNLSSRVVRARVATPTGEIVECAEDSDELRAARVSVGALGVLTEVTIECVPAFRIHRIDEPLPLTDVLADLDRFADDNDHFELFAFPHADRCLTMRSTRTDEPARPRSRASSLWHDEVVGNGLFGAAMEAGRRAPGLTPRIARAVTRVLSREEHLDDSFRVYAHPRRVRFVEQEYALPRAAARPALEATLELIRARGEKVAFPIEVRFAAGDDAFLSTAHGRDTAYIAVHQRIGMPHDAYFRAVEEIMLAHDGRPHWGKRHTLTSAQLAPRYPEWESFQAVRARLDPGGVCGNAHTDAVLGAVPTGVAA